MQYQKQEIKNRIIKVAIEEFDKFNYEGVSIRHICKLSDISIGNFYRYFKNKESLLTEIVNNVYNESANIIKQEYSKNLSLDELFNTVVDNLIRLYKKYGKQLIIILDKTEGSKFKNIKEPIIVLASHKIEEAYSEINFKSDELINKIIATNIIEGVIQIMKSEQELDKMASKIRSLLTFYFGKSKELNIY